MHIDDVRNIISQLSSDPASSIEKVSYNSSFEPRRHHRRARANRDVPFRSATDTIRLLQRQVSDLQRSPKHTMVSSKTSPTTPSVTTATTAATTAAPATTTTGSIAVTAAPATVGGTHTDDRSPTRSSTTSAALSAQPQPQLIEEFCPAGYLVCQFMKHDCGAKNRIIACYRAATPAPVLPVATPTSVPMVATPVLAGVEPTSRDVPDNCAADENAIRLLRKEYNTRQTNLQRDVDTTTAAHSAANRAQAEHHSVIEAGRRNAAELAAHITRTTDHAASAASLLSDHEATWARATSLHDPQHFQRSPAASPPSDPASSSSSVYCIPRKSESATATTGADDQPRLALPTHEAT